MEEKLIGEDGMVFITGCKNPKAVTLFARGGTEHVIEEVERALTDAIRVVGVAIEDGKVVAGAGAPEIEVGIRLASYASSIGGREQLAIEKFSKALEIIPWTLAENAGIDPIDSIINLKKAHKEHKNGSVYGIDLDSGEAVDMLKKDVVEPLRVKKQAISSAYEVANMILRIDDVITARRAQSPPPGAGGMGGMPPGMM